MNDNAKMWISALRSGDYEQGIGSLKTGNNFCCMGVACDLYSKSVGRGRWVNEVSDSLVASWFEVPGPGDPNEGGSDVFLPEVVMVWLGIENNCGRFFDSEVQGKDYDSLVDMNDNDSTFEDIASIIEAEPRGLFEE